MYVVSYVFCSTEFEHWFVNVNKHYKVIYFTFDDTFCAVKQKQNQFTIHMHETLDSAQSQCHFFVLCESVHCSIKQAYILKEFTSDFIGIQWNKIPLTLGFYISLVHFSVYFVKFSFSVFPRKKSAHNFKIVNGKIFWHISMWMFFYFTHFKWQ